MSPLRPRHGRLRLVVTVAALLATASLAGCSSKSDDTGVASLAEATPAGGSTASASASGDTEQQLLAYTQCLRDQGLDVPDPQVDADGNVVLGGGGGGGAGGGTPPDRAKLDAATKVCGDPPAGLTSQLNQFNSPEFQDALVAFTKCLRDKGYDVADIDTSGGAPGPGANPLGNLNTDDPTVAADIQACQSSAFAGVNLPGGAPGGASS